MDLFVFYIKINWNLSKVKQSNVDFKLIVRTNQFKMNYYKARNNISNENLI